MSGRPTHSRGHALRRRRSAEPLRVSALRVTIADAKVATGKGFAVARRAGGVVVAVGLTGVGVTSL